MTTTALIHGSTPSAIAHRGGERRPAAPAGTGLGGNTLAQIMEENCSDMLAAAGVAPHADYPPDGENILPVLLGDAPAHPRTLFWRYKAQRQRAVREGRYKYLRINDNEFLFDVEDDTLERANLRDKHPEVFERLRAAWEQWNAQFLPITDEVITHGLSPDIQADRYVPDLAERGM